MRRAMRLPYEGEQKVAIFELPLLVSRGVRTFTTLLDQSFLLSCPQRPLSTANTAITEPKTLHKYVFSCPAPPWLAPVDVVGVPVGGAVIKLSELPNAVDDAAKSIVTLVRPVTVAPAGV